MDGKKKRNTCLIVGLVLVGMCCCTIIGLGGGGYYLYTTGHLDLNEISALLGMGPVKIEIANLSDITLYAEITYEDDEVTGETHTHSSLVLEPFDIRVVSGLSARVYQVVFSSDGGMPNGGTCILKVRGGDHLTFIAVPEGIGVVREGDEVTTSEEVNITTSPICQGE